MRRLLDLDVLTCVLACADCVFQSGLEVVYARRFAVVVLLIALSCEPSFGRAAAYGKFFA